MYEEFGLGRSLTNWCLNTNWESWCIKICWRALNKIVSRQTLQCTILRAGNIPCSRSIIIIIICHSHNGFFHSCLLPKQMEMIFFFLVHESHKTLQLLEKYILNILIQPLPGFYEKKLQCAKRNSHNHAMPHTFQMIQNTAAKTVLNLPRHHTLLHLLLKVKKELWGC